MFCDLQQADEQVKDDFRLHTRSFASESAEDITQNHVWITLTAKSKENVFQKRKIDLSKDSKTFFFIVTFVHDS